MQVAIVKWSLTQIIVLGDSCHLGHDHGWSVDVCSYGARDGHNHSTTVDAANTYINQYGGLKYIFMSNQASHIKGLINHLVYPMQCFPNGVMMNEILKILGKH